MKGRMFTISLPINTMEGAFLAANWKRPFISFSPSPCHLEVSTEAVMLKRVDCVSAARALAISVFPLPGGPKNKIPRLGERRPRNKSGLKQRSVKRLRRVGKSLGEAVYTVGLFALPGKNRVNHALRPYLTYEFTGSNQLFFLTGDFRGFQLPLKYCFLLQQVYFLAFKLCTKLRRRLEKNDNFLYWSSLKFYFVHNLIHTISAKSPFQKTDIYRLFFGWIPWEKRFNGNFIKVLFSYFYISGVPTGGNLVLVPSEI